MTTRRGKTEPKIVRYRSLDDMPAPEPFSEQLLALTDEEIDRAVAEDPDGGILPDEFWKDAVIVEPQGTEQITLRLPRRVLSHFRAGGKGYQSRISAVLSSYVDAKTGRR